MAGSGKGSRDPYPDEIRQAAEGLALDPDLSASMIRRRLADELGRDVPLETVSRWVRRTRAELPAPTIGDLSGRMLRLLERDLRRIESGPASKLDLDRLGKLAQTLKSIDGLKAQAKDPAKLKTLNDLSPSEAEPQNAFELVDGTSVSGLAALG